MIRIRKLYHLGEFGQEQIGIFPCAILCFSVRFHSGIKCFPLAGFFWKLDTFRVFIAISNMYRFPTCREINTLTNLFDYLEQNFLLIQSLTCMISHSENKAINVVEKLLHLALQCQTFLHAFRLKHLENLALCSEFLFTFVHLSSVRLIKARLQNEALKIPLLKIKAMIAEIAININLKKTKIRIYLPCFDPGAYAPFQHAPFGSKMAR